jgi:hypothetical protein
MEITVSFMGIHKWEPYIYIRFSPALHLQCMPGGDGGGDMAVGGGIRQDETVPLTE